MTDHTEDASLADRHDASQPARGQIGDSQRRLADAAAARRASQTRDAAPVDRRAAPRQHEAG